MKKNVIFCKKKAGKMCVICIENLGKMCYTYHINTTDGDIFEQKCNFGAFKMEAKRRTKAHGAQGCKTGRKDMDYEKLRQKLL